MILYFTVHHSSGKVDRHGVIASYELFGFTEAQCKGAVFLHGICGEIFNESDLKTCQFFSLTCAYLGSKSGLDDSWIMRSILHFTWLPVPGPWQPFRTSTNLYSKSSRNVHLPTRRLSVWGTSPAPRVSCFGMFGRSCPKSEAEVAARTGHPRLEHLFLGASGAWEEWKQWDDMMRSIKIWTPESKTDCVWWKFGVWKVRHAWSATKVVSFRASLNPSFEKLRNTCSKLPTLVAWMHTEMLLPYKHDDKLGLAGVCWWDDPYHSAYCMFLDAFSINAPALAD